MMQRKARTPGAWQKIMGEACHLIRSGAVVGGNPHSPNLAAGNAVLPSSRNAHYVGVRAARVRATTARQYRLNRCNKRRQVSAQQTRDVPLRHIIVFLLFFLSPFL
jgi:hypothetical protein